MLQHLKRLYFSTKPAFDIDFKSILIKYKGLLNELSRCGNGISSLDKLGIKLTNNKKSALLNEIGTFNIVDSQKVELTVHDPQVNYNYNYIIRNYISLSLLFILLSS